MFRVCFAIRKLDYAIKYSKEILVAIEDSNHLYHAIEFLLLSPIHCKLLRSQIIKLIDGWYSYLKLNQKFLKL
jgi:hypothetical protein